MRSSDWSSDVCSSDLFQVLQHRAAHLYSELEIARAATLKAQQLLDEDADEADMMVSVAKAKAGSASALAVREGVQMHGGIGMTDEYDIGLYMKRDRVLSELFGDAAYHADRVARLRSEEHTSELQSLMRHS